MKAPSSDEGEKTNKFEGSLRLDNIDDFDEDTVMNDLKDTTIGDFHDKTAIETPSDDTSRGDIKKSNSAEVDDFNNDNNKNKDVHNEEKVVSKKDMNSVKSNFGTDKFNKYTELISEDLLLLNKDEIKDYPLTDLEDGELKIVLQSLHPTILTKVLLYISDTSLIEIRDRLTQEEFDKILAIYLKII